MGQGKCDRGGTRGDGWDRWDRRNMNVQGNHGGDGTRGTGKTNVWWGLGGGCGLSGTAGKLFKKCYL